MSVAILTKFLPYTNTKQGRVKAFTAWNGNTKGRNITLPWDHALDAYGNHEKAAKALVERLEWAGEWIGGDCGETYVFVRKQSTMAFVAKGE